MWEAMRAAVTSTALFGTPTLGAALIAAIAIGAYALPLAEQHPSWMAEAFAERQASAIENHDLTAKAHARLAMLDRRLTGINLEARHLWERRLAGELQVRATASLPLFMGALAFSALGLGMGLVGRTLDRARLRALGFDEGQRSEPTDQAQV